MRYLVLLCGGKSIRFNNTLPKQFTEFNGKRIFEYSLSAFIESNLIDFVIIPADPEYFELLRNTLEPLDIKYKLVRPGETRQLSVYNSITSIESITDEDIVFIHDAARPLVSNKLIQSLYDCFLLKNSAVPYHFSTNAMYDVRTLEYINRNRIIEIETPQLFKLKDIKAAHDKAYIANFFNSPDDGFLYSKYIGQISIVENPSLNIKITYENDLKQLSEVIKHGN